MSEQPAAGGAPATGEQGQPPAGGAPGGAPAGAPGEEKKEEEQKPPEEEPMSLGRPLKKKNNMISFYDPPLQKPEEKFEAEEKKQNELLRRWKVHIYQIEIVNLSGKTMDPFVQFIIGGDYFIEIKKTSSGKMQFIYHGEKGIVYITDLVKLLEPNESKFFKIEIISEYRGSYFDLMQQRFHIELWNRSSFSLNTFIGYISIPLIEIANGPFRQYVIINEHAEEGKAQKPMASVSFNIFFEEIWDFYITFMDWKTSTIEHDKDKAMMLNPSAELRIQSKLSISDTAHSNVLKNNKFPHWSLFQQGIQYRGTYNDLKAERLQIKLWNNHLIGKQIIGQKTVPLKNFLDVNFIKAEMVIHKIKKRTSANIRDKAQTCSIQGTIRLGQQPKYHQSGEMEVIARSQNYLVVFITKLNVFDSLDDGGDVTVFATIEWAGTYKKTRNVRKANMNETIHFHIPIEEDVKKEPSKLQEFLNDELETKSELIFNVWADTGKVNLENLGSGKICLGILHTQRFEDKMFTDERTKQKVSIQCRVYTTTLKLHSAFFDTANSSISLSIWFQPDMPYPGVDLSKLRPKEEDIYPQTLEKGIKDCEYQIRFNDIIQKNFPQDYSIEGRRFEFLQFYDQYKSRHLLPLFISKITPPDSNFIEFDENGNLIRGIRTLGEVAHFVRCIPFKPNEFPKIWSAPDFLLQMKIGNVEEHALLLASMFRAVKYEYYADIEKEFQVKRFVAMQKNKEREIFGDLDEDAEIEGGEINTKDLAEAAVQQAMNHGQSKNRKKKGKQKQDEDYGIADRVFVCLGKLKENNQPSAWVMTISKTYDEVIFWEPNQSKKYTLHGRIAESEEKNLQGFLSPNMTEAEKKQIEEHRLLRRQESSKYLSDYDQTKGEGGINQDNDDDEMDEGGAGKNKMLLDEESKTITDDDKDSDSDFMEQMDKLVYFEDLPENLKGHNINYIGKLDGLSKEKQEYLKELDYQSEDEDGGPKTKKKGNKFLEEQDKQRLEKERRRADKHLLPVDKFYDKKTGQEPEKVNLPFQELDIIFNHKNVWANLQNPNPAYIFYHLHNESQWLPMITDLLIQHPIIVKEEEERRKLAAEEGNEQQDAQPQQNVEAIQEAAEQEKKKPKKKSNMNEALLDSKMKGDYMKPFTSFYDPKGLEPAYSHIQIEKFERNIYKDVEIALKQARSSKNLNTKIRKNVFTTNVLKLQLDLLEDIECDRIPHEKIQKEKDRMTQELFKLIPDDYRIQILPSFFNYTDQERIRTVIYDQGFDFMIKTPKKVMFAIGLKVYPFHNQIVSVRIAIAKMYKMESKEIMKKKMLQQLQQQKSQVEEEKVQPKEEPPKKDTKTKQSKK